MYCPGVIRRMRGVLFRLTLLLACLACLALAAPAARAANLSWLGTGGDQNWSTAANWNGGAAPVDGDKLIFDSGSGVNLTSNNDIVGLNNLSLQASSNVGGNVSVSGSSFRMGVLGIYNLSTHVLTVNNDITLASSASVVVTNNGASVVLNGDIDIGSNDFNMQSYASGSGVSHVLGGTVSGTGTVQYSSNGGDVVEVRAAQTYTGLTRLMNSGGIRLSGAGSMPDNGYLLLNDSGTSFDLNGVSDTIGHIAGYGQVLLGGATLTTGGDNASSNLTGVISGAGNLVKEGTGTFMLRGANTYTGQTRINAGALLTLQRERIPDGSAVILSGSATLSLSGDQETIGSLAGGASNTVNTGVTTLITGGDNTSTTFSGVIAGSGGLTKTGAGVFTLAGVNTFTGGARVSAGTLRLSGGDNRLPAAGNLTVDAGATFDLNGLNQTVGGLSGGGVVTTGAGLLTISNNLAPGASPGAITVGNFSLGAGASTNLELNGTTAGAQYDQVTATGDVSLNGALSVTLGFTPAENQVFTIINKTSAGAVTGTFTGLAEGDTLTVNGIDLRISYVGGDGNDVTLTRPVSPPPPAPAPQPAPKPKTRPAPNVGPEWSPSPNRSTQGPILSWPSVPGASSYRVYRANCPACAREQVGRASGVEFTDDSARPGQVYYYFLRSENEGGQGGYSDWIPAWRYEQNPGRVGDYNGDGVMDLLWWEPDDNQLRVWSLGGGRVHQVYSLGQGEDVSQWLLADSGDYNGDGIWDLLWWNPTSGQVVIWLLESGEDAAQAAQADDSDGAWRVKTKLELGGSAPGNAVRLYTGDLNGDGREDMLWRDYSSGQLAIWLMNADGQPDFNGEPSFSEGCPVRRLGGADLIGLYIDQSEQPASDDLPGVSGSLEWRVAALGDVDGDGKADVLWRQADGGRVAVWLMDGSRIVGVREYEAQNAGDWSLAASGDLIPGGRAEMVWQNDIGGTIRLWLLDENGIITAQREISPGDDPAAWQIKGVGDFWGDGGQEMYCKQENDGRSRIITGGGRLYDLAAP